MTALGFKPRFVPVVEQRIKRQSIRARGDRFHVGRPIQLYTGMRTKACRKLVAEDPVCTSVEPVSIKADAVLLGSSLLIGEPLLAFARADGFDDLAAFLAFFLTDVDRFDGFLIKWDWTT